MIPLLTIISTALGMSHNEGARKFGNLINSAASFVRKKPKDPKDPKDKTGL